MMIDPECTRPPERVHGTRSAFQDGCVCPGAAAANREYIRAWKRTAVGRRYVERKNAERRTGTTDPRTVRRQRRQALARAMHERGAGPGEIARELGVNRRTAERYLQS